MLRAVFTSIKRTDKLGFSWIARRQAPALRPQVESLGTRILPTIGVIPFSPVVPHIPYNNLQIVPQPLPTLFTPPSVVNKTVELTTGPQGTGTDLGTLTFTAQSGFNFQGTFLSKAVSKVTLGIGADKYQAILRIPGEPISGSFSFQGSAGGAVTWGISFSGSTSGLVTETYTYAEDDPSNPNDPLRGTTEGEIRLVMDQQSISFNGTLTVSGSTLTLAGSFAETDRAQWDWSADYLRPSDPRHQVYQAEQGPFGMTLDFQITTNIAPTNI
jgi:hypothetical protein